MHSPRSSFAIASTAEGGRSSDDDEGGDGTSASSPRPIGRGGGVLPEGDVVAAARPGEKGRVPHPTTAAAAAFQTSRTHRKASYDDMIRRHGDTFSLDRLLNPISASADASSASDRAADARSRPSSISEAALED